MEKEIRNDGMVNTLDSVQKDNWLAVEVREVTSKGYAVARGGGMLATSQCRNAKQEGEESG